MNENQKVWRYMSFSRFVWMLHRKQLWLSRADLLGDPWEMSPSYSQVAMARSVTGLNAVEPTIMPGPLAFQTIVEEWRSRTFINCWTAQEHELHALWRIYCGGATDGVAIQTTLSRLADSVKDAQVHRVIYRDPEERPLDPNILLTELAIEKRPMFSYEREVRVVLKAAAPAVELGVSLPWNPKDVLESVYIHPEADNSFMETVHAVVEQSAPALTRRLNWSAMRLRPPF